MAATNPLAIKGPWRAGSALDYQIVSSVYIGDDAYGHPRFDTQRTELGELLYRLKYRGDDSVVAEIAGTVAAFADRWRKELTMIVPVPPSNERRVRQPALVLARALGERLGLPVSERAVAKIKRSPQLKDVYDYRERLRLLDQAFTADPSVVSGQTVLLFDDLYRSGATMESVTKALFEQGRAADVYALAVTRTRKLS